MGLSAAQMQESVIKNLPSKTGKTIDEWVMVARELNLPKPSDVVKKLKADFGLGHVQAQTIAWRMNGEKPYVETEGYEAGIFKNTLSEYLKIKESILALSKTVSAKPCKTYIPFYSKKQFAILTEKDGKLILGLNLPADVFPELEPAHKIGGSERINRMVMLNNKPFSALQPYLHCALQINS